MVSPDRPTANHIINDLLAHSESYSFFQAVKLLTDYSQLVSNESGKQVFKETLILFSANPQLAYHKSDVDTIVLKEANEKMMAKMTVNFMGLYGATSPLPVFYSEAILQAKNGEDLTRKFMDLFNHRMISLIYKCWEKYRYYQNYKEGSNDQFSNWMFSLTGLFQNESISEIRNDKDVNWNHLLPFLAMMGMRCHSTSVIESILKFYFNFDSIYLESNVKRFVEIEADQTNRLGQQCVSLSSDLVLGDKVEDRAGKFRIKISQLPYELFIKFLPHGEYNRPLKKIINFLLRDQLDYDIELKLLKQEVPELSISHQNHEKLGWTTWVGCHEQQNTSVLIPGRA